MLLLQPVASLTTDKSEESSQDVAPARAARRMSQIRAFSVLHACLKPGLLGSRAPVRGDQDVHLCDTSTLDFSLSSHMRTDMKRVFKL